MLKELKSFKKAKLMVTVLLENQFVECQHKRSWKQDENSLKNTTDLCLFHAVVSEYWDLEY